MRSIRIADRLEPDSRTAITNSQALQVGIEMRAYPVRNQLWISWGLFSLALLGAWMFGGWVVAGDLKTIVYAFVAIVVCAIALSIMKDWRAGFYIFIIWLLFEDMVRKFLGNNMVIYFAKDALAAILYISFFLAVRKRRAVIFRFPFMIYLSLFVWLGVLQCFNVGSPSLLYSLLGLKLYFYYIPLVFVGYSLIRTEEDLRGFLVINMSLGGVIAFLGIIQSIIGPSFLNPSVLAPDIQDLSTLYRYAPISGSIIYRPTSVFVSDGRFAAYLLLLWVLGLGAAGLLLLKRLRGHVIIFSGLAAVAVALVMCGGRGALVWSMGSGLVLGAAFLWGAPWKARQAHRIAKAIWRTSAAAGVAILVVIFFFPQDVGARWDFYSETLLPGSSAQEVTDRMGTYPQEEFAKAFEQGGWILGHGIGTASLGVQYVSRWLGQRPPDIGVESGYGDILLEFGIVGLFVWFVWTAALLITAWRVVRRLRGTAYFPLAFAIFWFAFLLLYPSTYGTLNEFQNYIYNAYLWLLIGVLYRLPSLANRPLVVGGAQINSGI